MTPTLSKAFEIAKKAHGKQMRKFDNSPYYEHLREVVEILEYFGIKDNDILTAALLHDTLEDTTLDSTTILNVFGANVLSLVEGLTDNKSLPLQERKTNSLNKIKTLSGDAQTIKLADLVSNLSALPESWSSEKLAEYFRWCQKLISSCEKAHPSLIELAQYLLNNQSGQVDDFARLEKWAVSGNLYWSAEHQHFLLVYYAGMGNAEAHVFHPKNLELSALFKLNLLRNLFASPTNTGSVLVVGGPPSSTNKDAKGYFADCTAISYK